MDECMAEWGFGVSLRVECLPFLPSFYQMFGVRARVSESDCERVCECVYCFIGFYMCLSI